MQMTDLREPPQAEVVAQLVARCRPDLETLFRRHWVTDEEAEELLDDVLSILVFFRWSQLDDPTSWLLRTMERAIAHRLLLPLFGPDQGQPEPEPADPDFPGCSPPNEIV